MFDTMTVTKAAGALIGSLLFLLLTSWAASGLYHVGPSEHVAEGEAVWVDEGFEFGIGDVGDAAVGGGDGLHGDPQAVKVGSRWVSRPLKWVDSTRVSAML